MWKTAGAKLRDWYIVVIALLLFGGGFFLASHQSSSTAPAAAIHTAGPSPAPETAAALPEHQHQVTAAAPAAATPTAASNPTPTAPATAPKAAQTAAQPSSSDEHAAMHTMAAVEPQTQAPPAGGAAAAPLAGGEAAAGRLVFRKCQACHSMEPGKALLGPSLAGIVGRKAGTEANYNYIRRR